MRRALARARGALGRAGAAAWAVRAPLLHVLSILVGWLLLTLGLAALLGGVEIDRVSFRVEAEDVYLLSAGALFLSLAGWGHLRTLFTAGVYALSRLSREDRR